MKTLSCLLFFCLAAFVLAPSAALAGKANAFNPFVNSTLPNMRAPSAEDKSAMQAFGAHETTLQKEAAYRNTWKAELYPVLWGKAQAAGEILVLLDFSQPASEQVWQAALQASKKLDPAQNKLVLFGQSREQYATDLLGLGIWIASMRDGKQAADYMTFALHRWNEVKKGQRAAGHSKPFTNEYDAVLSDTELPLHYAYMKKIRPAIAEPDELPLAKYCYEAGGVNVYQTTQIRQYYGVQALPAVVVNGTVLEAKAITPEAIYKLAQ
ncbi:MAG: hypothetical protein PHN64_10565 [Desulfovibrionaceae bacterium]|nr:hypothetical protein [Desulfovibrionaceae bacterium]